MAVETLAEDVLGKFCTSPSTQRIFDQWREDPRRRVVAPIVLQHRTRLVYELTLDDVRSVCERTEHALGEVPREEGEAVHAIVDWHPDFAFTHMFHICMEKIGHLPTYQSFRRFAEEDKLGQKMLGSPSREKVREVTRSGVPESSVKAAVRWRVGNAYYSFLREIYTVVTLRRAGVDLQLHPLADALFRVDAWTGHTALSLLVENKKFRQGEHSGRKRPPEQLLADVTPPLDFQRIELGKATKFGRVHLPSSEQLARIASRLGGRGT